MASRYIGFGRAYWCPNCGERANVIWSKSTKDVLVLACPCCDAWHRRYTHTGHLILPGGTT